MTAHQRRRYDLNADEYADPLPLDLPSPHPESTETTPLAADEFAELSPDDAAGLGRQIVHELLQLMDQPLRRNTPLQAEIIVSGLLGKIRGSAPPEADVDLFVEQQLIPAIAEAGGDTALAFLRTLETLGETPGQRRAAGRYAHQPAATGARAARWSEQLGTVTVQDCWTLTDAFGDYTTLFCVFAYGQRRHGLMALIELTDPMGRVDDLDPVEEDEFVDVERKFLNMVTVDAGLTHLERVEPSRARALLEAGIAAADRRVEEAGPAGDEAVNAEPIDADELEDDIFQLVRAFALARARTMPPAASDVPVPPAPLQTQAERDAVVAEFLAAPQASHLAKDAATEQLADLIIEYGCEVDPVRPLRVSPIKTARFLLEFVPVEVTLSPLARERLPHMVEAWTRWRAHAEGLPPAAREELETALGQTVADFRGQDAGGEQQAVPDDSLGLAEIAELLRGFAGGRERTLPDRHGDPDAVYVVKVSLAHTKPPIWRRLRIPSDASLAQLHRVLQAAFDWHDGHLHRFELPGRNRHDMPLELGSESTRRLYQLLVEPGDRLDYTYDFGDDWAHRIILEKVEPADGVRHAVCVAGRRAAPPEDSGGMYGYESLCAAVADPTHPEHREMIAWLQQVWGIDSFDPAVFAMDELNERLAAVSLRRRKKT